RSGRRVGTVTRLCSPSRGSQLNRRLWAVPQRTDDNAAAIPPIVRTIRWPCLICTAPDEPSCEDGGGVPPYAKLRSINEAIATDKISLSISNLLVFSRENRMEGLGFR